MFRLLLILFNHRAVITFSVTIFAMAAFLLARDGLNPADLLILTGVGAALFGVWRLLFTRGTLGVDTVSAVRNAVRNGETPTLIQYYSEQCVGCMAMKPLVDSLEKEAGQRLQIIKLDIHDEPGKTLMKDHDVVFTPTFVFFDTEGNPVMTSSLILDKPRILYEMEQLGA